MLNLPKLCSEIRYINYANKYPGSNHLAAVFLCFINLDCYRKQNVHAVVLIFSCLKVDVV